MLVGMELRMEFRDNWGFERGFDCRVRTDLLGHEEVSRVTMTDNSANNSANKPSDLAVQRAASLAAKHGHGWASWLSDDERAAIVAHRTAVLAYQEERARTWYPDLPSPGELTLPDVPLEVEKRLPRTNEEAEIHSYLEQQLGNGRGMFGLLWVPLPDGSIRHITGTGRVRWTISQDGHTVISVRRPDPAGEDGIECLSAALTVDGQLTIFRGLVEFEDRHVDAMIRCLRALGIGSATLRRIVWDLCPSERPLLPILSGETAGAYLERMRVERDRWVENDSYQGMAE